MGKESSLNLLGLPPNFGISPSNQAQAVAIYLYPTPELIASFRDVVRAELSNFVPPNPKQADLPTFLSRKETAKLLNVSLVTLHEWARSNEERGPVLQPKKIAGRVLYAREDVLLALKTHSRFKERA